MEQRIKIKANRGEDMLPPSQVKGDKGAYYGMPASQVDLIVKMWNEVLRRDPSAIDILEHKDWSAEDIRGMLAGSDEATHDALKRPLYGTDTYTHDPKSGDELPQKMTGDQLEKWRTDPEGWNEKPPVVDETVVIDTPEIEALKATIDERLVATKDLPENVKPVFDDKYIGQWNQTLTTMFAPQEAEARKNVTEQMNYLSPFTLGSSQHVGAIKDLETNIASNRMTNALSLGTQQFAQEAEAYQREQDRRATEMEALTARQLQLAELKNRRQEFKSSTDWANYWDQQKRVWDLEDQARQRKYELEDYSTEKYDTEKLMEKYYTPRQPQWYEQFLTPIATGAGYAMGGAVGGKIAGGMMDWLTPKKTP